MRCGSTAVKFDFGFIQNDSQQGAAITVCKEDVTWAKRERNFFQKERKSEALFPFVKKKNVQVFESE